MHTHLPDNWRAENLDLLRVYTNEYAHVLELDRCGRVKGGTRLEASPAEQGIQDAGTGAGLSMPSFITQILAPICTPPPLLSCIGDGMPVGTGLLMMGIRMDGEHA